MNASYNQEQQIRQLEALRTLRRARLRPYPERLPLFETLLVALGFAVLAMAGALVRLCRWCAAPLP